MTLQTTLVDDPKSFKVVFQSKAFAHRQPGTPGVHVKSARFPYYAQRNIAWRWLSITPSDHVVDQGRETEIIKEHSTIDGPHGKSSVVNTSHGGGVEFIEWYC